MAPTKVLKELTKNRPKRRRATGFDRDENTRRRQDNRTSFDAQQRGRNFGGTVFRRARASGHARRVERLYRWYLDQREDEENDEDDDDKENDRTNSKYSRYHPGAAIQKFLNEYFEPLAKLATKHEGTVLNFAAHTCLREDKGEGGS